MIPQAAIDQYLAEQRDDHRWMKKLTHADIDAALASLDPRPRLYPKLRLHQKVCIYLGIAFPQFLFFCDMGTGKTVITLELMRYWMDCGKLNRAIIFVTSDKAFPTWEKQNRQYDINLPYVTLEDSASVDKWAALESFDSGLIFATYPGAVAMTTTKVRIKGKNKMAIDDDKAEQLFEGVDAFVMDESTRAGNDSLWHKLCLRLCRNTEIHYGLAGRPFGRNPELLWRQYYLIDEGEAMGETLGLFRAAFFTATKNPYAERRSPRGKYAMDYTFKARMLPQLRQMMQHRSITYRAKECIDLPKMLPVIEPVQLPEEAGAYCERFIQQVIAAQGNLREVKNIFLRMRQLSSGFLGFKDDESGERAEIEFAANPKRDRLFELIDSIPEDCKVVVFYDFTISGRRIMEELKRRKQGAIWLWSGTKDPREDKRRFEEDPNCTVAIINNRVGAYSLDGLQVANYGVFYETPVGSIDREQAERRLWRQGQERTVFLYDLVVEGTLDTKILEHHGEARSIMDVLANDARSLFGRAT
jgi:hypothetical protein